MNIFTFWCVFLFCFVFVWFSQVFVKNVNKCIFKIFFRVSKRLFLLQKKKKKLVQLPWEHILMWTIKRGKWMTVALFQNLQSKDILSCERWISNPHHLVNKTLILQSLKEDLTCCLTLCDPMDCSPLGFSVHGILQARTLEWVAISSFRGSFQLRDQTRISCVSWIGRCVPYH